MDIRIRKKELWSTDKFKLINMHYKIYISYRQVYCLLLPLLIIIIYSPIVSQLISLLVTKYTTILEIQIHIDIMHACMLVKQILCDL